MVSSSSVCIGGSSLVFANSIRDGAGSIHLGILAAVQQCQSKSGLYGWQEPIDVTATTYKAVASLDCKGTVVQAAC